jgi:hypothetical protein
MASQYIQYEDCENSWSICQGELLEALLQPEEDFYPWNPAEPETEAYFAELERDFLLAHCPEEEIACASQAFFNQLHQYWPSPLPSATDRLKASLSQRFADLVPQAWLEEIAHKAQQVFPSNLSLADQLVLCVKPLLPNWLEEDLLVFARPLAYAMRGSSKPSGPGTPGLVGPVEWTELSQMERVRLSLSVAHSALVELQESSSDPEQS